MQLPAGYYAVPDPTTTEPTMTFWHAPAPGEQPTLTAWPPKARYGPILLRKDVPKGYAAQAAAWKAFAPKRQAYLQQIRTAISHDPATAAVSFATAHGRCSNCCRALKDARSLLLCIGPDCRRHAGLNDSALIRMESPALAAMQALHHAQRTAAAA